MSRRVIELLLTLVLLAGCGGQAAGEQDHSDRSEASAETPAPVPMSESEAAVEKQPDGSYRFFPISGPAEIGRSYEYTAYTHCGLDYKFDFDGSLWEVVDRPRDEDVRVQDPKDHGVVELVQGDIAVFTSHRGGEYRLARREDPKVVAGLCE